MGNFLLASLLLASCSAAAVPNIDDVHARLRALVTSQAHAFNISFSVAATFGDGSTVTAAAGFNDHATGTSVDADTQYPSGSVTKTFTAVGVLHLVEQGKLDLEATVASVVDPWLKMQGRPSLKEQWNGDATIDSITVHQLLTMRSGVSDYDDHAVRTFTATHKEDYTPEYFVGNASKAFVFPPGTGGSYSGVGYILLGWVLCAASDTCPTSFADLDQRALVDTTTFQLNASGMRFMGKGPCSKYPRVVHQYLFNRKPQKMVAWPVDEAAVDARMPAGTQSRSRSDLELQFGLSGPTAAAWSGPAATATTSRNGKPLPKHCTVHTTGRDGTWYPHIAMTGPKVGQRNVSEGGAEACCALSDDTPGAAIWSFAPAAPSANAKAGAGVCTFFPWVEGVKPHQQLNATSGRADPLVHSTDFQDIYDASCLNGWTMGNIATTTREVTRFYHHLFKGDVVSASSLKMMQEWNPLTTGFAPGTPYGMGLMLGQVAVPIATRPSRAACSALPGCKCTFFQGCYFYAPSIGHAGLDYGSGMPVVGHVELLNVSYAMAVNIGEEMIGMNTSLGIVENANIWNTVYCGFWDVIVHAALPSFPAFNCDGV